MGASGLWSHRTFWTVRSLIHSINLTENTGNCARCWCLSLHLFGPALNVYMIKWKCLYSSQLMEENKSQIILYKLPFWIAYISYHLTPPSHPIWWKGQRFWLQTVVWSQTSESVRVCWEFLWDDSQAGLGYTTPITQSYIRHPLYPLLELVLPKNIHSLSSKSDSNWFTLLYTQN